MRFYTTQHRYYCGIDLHARSLYVCILNQAGEILVHHNLPADPALIRVSATGASFPEMLRQELVRPPRAPLP